MHTLTKTAVTIIALSPSTWAWTPRAIPLPESTPRHVVIDDEFSQSHNPASAVSRARRLFDARYGTGGEDEHADRAATAANFRWEWWHAGKNGQYVSLRTPAASFLEDDSDPELYADLCDAITTFGQQQLGMNAASPPWLSLYIDGCEQRLHTDAPHGPWAYVLSLTTDEVADSLDGGETVIMKPEILDYWRGFDGFAMEEGDLFEKIRPAFGRFLSFDPRLPHGVRQVRGPRAMESGRLVIHGWFSEPTPFLVGGLEARGGGHAGSAEEQTAEDGDEDEDGDEKLREVDEENEAPEVVAAAKVLDEGLNAAMEALGSVGRVTGCLSVRMVVDGNSGEVVEVDSLADSLVPDPDDFQGVIGETEEGEAIYEDARADVLLTLQQALSALRFPSAPSGEDTVITVPFVFE